MALVTTITPSEIAVALGVDAPAEGDPKFDQWAMWIGDALMLISVRATELGVADGDVDQARLNYVIREAVVAHVRQPDSATEVTVAVDDGSSTKRYRSADGRVGIRDEWWSLLGLTPDGGQAFNIDTVPSAAGHAPFCSLMFGGTTCSCGANLAGYPLWEF